jgi:DNA-directed RNA polymerase sigma subunit (sigma70/sigma32)
MSDSKTQSLLEGAESLSKGKKAPRKSPGKQKRRALSMDEKLRNLAEGSDPGRIYTLDEIGTTMGVTRERIRQIEQRALQKFYWHITKVMKDDDITVEQMFDIIRKANKGGTDEYDEA